jgi:iron complex transport system permease protein
MGKGITGALVRNVIILVIAILLAVIFSASIGAAKISFFDSAKVILSKLPFLSRVEAFSSYDLQDSIIILNIRLPRIVLSIVVGMALATAGVVFQSMFKNPMADPYVIGVSSGAALGATVSIILHLGTGVLGASSTSAFAFIGAMCATAVVYRVARFKGKIGVYSLLLSGLAIGSLLSAGTSFLMLIGEHDLGKVIFWMLGSLSTSSWEKVVIAAPLTIVLFLISLFFTRDLNLFLMGEDRAAQLGLEVERTKIILLILGSFIASVAVSVSGLISFIGLITPHLVRLITGPNHKVLLPTSALTGGLILLLSDTLARVVIAPRELPVGVITAILGAPFFIYLLRRRYVSG